MADGTYGNSAAGGTNITTITEYRGIHPASPPASRSSATTSSSCALACATREPARAPRGPGLGYQDSQNYYEVVVSASAR